MAWAIARSITFAINPRNACIESILRLQMGGDEAAKIQIFIVGKMNPAAANAFAGLSSPRVILHQA
jgi:hypothetical protein